MFVLIKLLLLKLSELTFKKKNSEVHSLVHVKKNIIYLFFVYFLFMGKILMWTKPCLTTNQNIYCHYS